MNQPKDYDQDERLNRRRVDKGVSVTITGNKAVVLLSSGVVGVMISSVVYATVWLTRIDQDVSHNTLTLQEIKVLDESQNKAIKELQINGSKLTYVVDKLVDQIDIFGGRKKNVAP